MFDLLREIDRWRRTDPRVAVATVVYVSGSSLQPMGAKMAISWSGDIAGSVSGGCIDADVYGQALKVLKSGKPQLLDYDVSSQTPWDVSLACGSSLQIWVESLTEGIYGPLKEALAQKEPVALATVVAGPDMGTKQLVWQSGRTQSLIGSDPLTDQVTHYAIQRLTAQEPGRTKLSVANDSVDIFVEVFAPLPRLIVVGAVHTAIPLVTIAKTLNMHTIVVDARSAFATSNRFPHADELLVEWPDTALGKMNLDENSYVVILTHDDKIDLPALKTVLASRARYIGILGSRKSHAGRVAELKQAGISDEQLARIHAPIGLNVGAIGPAEIAVSVMAEVVATRHDIVAASNTARMRAP